MLSSCLEGLITMSEEKRVIKLEPPLINEGTVLRRITGTRPVREGTFNISLDDSCTGKMIVNCYGHGGAGWTTLFGSVNRAIELFRTETDQSVPLRVIGAGCMGLTMAIELARQGFKVAGITTLALYDTASWRAGGYCALQSLKTAPEEQENVNQICAETFKVYQQIDLGDHPYITKEAVAFMPVYYSKSASSGIEDFEAKGLVPPPEDVILEFGRGVRHPNFVRGMTYYMNTTKLMQQLLREVERLSIPIEIGEIVAYEEVKEAVIFNCSGVGARKLNRDPFLTPVRGHLVLLNPAASASPIDYMILTKVPQDDTEEYVYIMPKDTVVFSEHPHEIDCRAVLGGTFIPIPENISAKELEELDRIEFKKLLDRNSLFFHGVPF